MKELDRRIGRRIEARRISEGLTRNALAQKLGEEYDNEITFSYGQIYDFETGHTRVSAVLLYKIGKILGVMPSYFMQRSDHNPEEKYEQEMMAHRFMEINNTELQRNLLNMADLLKKKEKKNNN